MKKKTLILVSGLLSNERVWSHQMQHLRDIADIKVVSPSQDTPEKMVQEILEKAPETFAIAGHSMGGWLCLEVMRRAPSRVSKLCLINTTAKPDSPEKATRRKEMIQKAKEGHFSELAHEIADNFVLNKSVKTDVEKMLLEVGENAFCRQEHSMLIREECLSILPTIKCPTLVIRSVHDKVFSLVDHQELADNITNAKLAHIEDSGHMTPMEMPQAVTTLLRYWLTY